MAAIDFPASPTTGQLFSAANGVTYQYNGTLWLVQAGPGGGTGDFCASGGGTLATSGTVFVFNTVISGNASGAYSTSTGRYTPPAGRFFMQATAAGTNAGATPNIVISLRKNGVIQTSSHDMGAVNTASAVSVQATLDANGADYFDVLLWAGSASTIVAAGDAVFTAFPLTGMQGPMGPPFGGGTGDFMATGVTGTNLAPPAASYVLVFPTIMTGNTGNYYNSANGRWTPPAGRYSISAGFSAYRTAVGGLFLQMSLRKNGVVIASGTSGNTASTSTGVVCSAQTEAVLDANGTDYFDVTGYASIDLSAVSGSWFTAFPLTGMQGPMGPPFSKPTMQLDNEVVLASPAVSMTVTIPPTAKAIEIWFATSNVGSANDASGLILNDVQSGTPNVGANHSVQNLYGSAAATGAAAASSLNGWNLGGVQMAFWGVLRVHQGPIYNNTIIADYAFTNAAGTHYKEQVDFYGGNAGTTGFRLQNGSGTQFIAGSYMRVFAVL